MEAISNKLVIIGNGFDLAHKFKTSYNDFILWYLNEFIKNRNHSDEILNAEGCGDANFENNEVRGINSIKDFQEKYIGRGLIKIKSNFFNQLNRKHEAYNWVDIEKEYYSSVWS